MLTPAWPWLHGYLSGEPAHFDLGQLIQPMLFVSLALVAAGIGLGWLIYRKAAESDPLAQAQPALFRFLENKMWLDELYAHTVIASPAWPRASPTGWIAISGMAGARGRRNRSALWQS